jgi:hypothetical protein
MSWREVESMVLWGWICSCGAETSKDAEFEVAKISARDHDRDTHGGARTAVLVSTVAVTVA